MICGIEKVEARVDWEHFDALSRRQRDLSRRMGVIERAIRARDQASGAARNFLYKPHIARHADPRWQHLLNMHARCFAEQCAMARDEFADVPGASNLALHHRIDRAKVREMPDYQLRMIRGIGARRLAALRVVLPFKGAHNTHNAGRAIAL